MQAEGKPDEARAHLHRAITLNPDLVEAHIELGILAWKANDAVGARESFERAARLAPWDGKAIGTLAQFRAASGIARGTVSVDLGALEDAAEAVPYARLPYYLGRLYVATLEG